MTEVEIDTPAALMPAALRQALEKLVESGGIELPVLPEVASQVLTSSMDVECDLRQLTALIHRDQSMTAHLLRLSNSALYAPPTPIVSLQQALNRLGLKKIREIALIISCESRVFRVDGFDLMVRGLFRHSLAAAAYAQEIARARRWNVEEAFLCGLLHDVGKPILLQTLVDLKRKLGVEVEREAIAAGADDFHCRVGGALVKNWKLPVRLAETILHHHDPGEAGEAAPTASMTRLADDLAHFALGSRDVAAQALVDHPMIGPLNIYPDEMEGLIAMKDRVCGTVDSIS